HFAILQRQLRYVALATVEVISLATSVGTGIALALLGFGYWALVIATVVAPVCSTICLWFATGWVPAAPRRSPGVTSTAAFGGMMTLNVLIVYIAYNMDKVLIGRVWGAAALGSYGRAFQLATLPSDNINSAIGGVAFAALSRLQDDPIRFKSYFLRGYCLVISLVFPIVIFSGMQAPDIVRVVLGPQWSDAAGPLRLLAPAMLVLAIINPLGWLMFACGMGLRRNGIALVIAPIGIGAYTVGLPFGPEGVALAFSVAMVGWLVPHVAWCLRGMPISLADLGKAVSYPLMAATVAGLCA